MRIVPVFVGVFISYEEVLYFYFHMDTLYFCDIADVFPLGYYVFLKHCICISIRIHCAQLVPGIMRLLAAQSRAPSGRQRATSAMCIQEKTHQGNNVLLSFF